MLGLIQFELNTGVEEKHEIDEVAVGQGFVQSQALDEQGLDIRFLKDLGT